MLRRIQLNVNGETYELDAEPHWTLLKVLRERLGLTGAKPGCLTGDCGACRVIVDGVAVNSCIVYAVRVAGRRISTIEGLVERGRLHPLQEAFIRHGALQCGFCIPGALMSMKALLDRNPTPSVDQVRKALRGNLCRCGSYTSMTQAVLEAAAVLRGALKNGG
ncbi:MAG: (2Fe-2S)-binding protein [Candidatus Bathyarchaeia archaeon]